jgi:hypothetical protein
MKAAGPAVQILCAKDAAEERLDLLHSGFII